MNLSYRLTDGIGVVRVHAPRIDAAVAIRFKDLFAEVTGAGAPIVVLDLAEVEFIDSSGLGAIVAVRKRLGEGQALALASLRPSVDKVMRLTHMDKVFDIHPDATACLAGQDRPAAV